MERFQLKLRLSMAFRPLSVVGGRQANDAIASERNLFSENHNYKRFFRVAVNTYVPIFLGLDVRGGRENYEQTHTHTG